LVAVYGPIEKLNGINELHRNEDFSTRKKFSAKPEFWEKTSVCEQKQYGNSTTA
jgi:hypothetical protein